MVPVRMATLVRSRPAAHAQGKKNGGHARYQQAADFGRRARDLGRKAFEISRDRSYHPVAVSAPSEAKSE